MVDLSIVMLVYQRVSFFPHQNPNPMATKEALQAMLQAPRDRGIVPTAVNAESIAWKKGRTGTHPGDPWGLGRGLGLSLDSFY